MLMFRKIKMIGTNDFKLFVRSIYSTICTGNTESQFMKSFYHEWRAECIQAPGLVINYK